ncbi:GNAT family N-acetyltransferase [Devosia pacifica]|nr:GNAT family N-acetyltransferase [Devosia pacifica]
MSVRIETDRLVLRLPRLDDAEAVSHYLDDYGVAGNLARVPLPYTLSDAQTWLHSRNVSLPPAETSFIIATPDDACIGVVGFHQGREGIVFGYWLGRPFWNRGMMTEAGAAALDWLFENSLTERVLSGVFAFNAASLAVQHKLGFTEIGRSSQVCLARGGELEHIDTQLTRSVWKARR